MTAAHRSLRRPAGLLVAAVLIAACSGSDSADPAEVAVGASTTPPTTVAAPVTLGPITIDAEVTAELESSSGLLGCDGLDQRSCLLPYPSDFFTQPDPTTDTGRRVSFPADQTPGNTAGVRIDPAEWNRSDGFSPNSSILTFVPGLDAAASNLPSWTDPGASLAADSPVVLIDMATAERVPLWAELDAKAADPADRLLVIHPAVPLEEGRQFAVALRTLRTATGSPIEPGVQFRAYRDRIGGPDWLEVRRSAMETTFAALSASGVDRGELYLAWSFTVASTRNLAERMLGIRDASLAFLPPEGPAVTITEVIDRPDDAELIARQVIGTVEVPNFLTLDGGPGNGFFYGADGLSSPDEIPQQNGTLQAGFRCNIPRSAYGAAEPSHLVLYGHGLLGSDDEIDAGNVRRMAAEHNVIHCATKWAGMSEDDVPNAIAALQDFSRFPTVADRLQQGVLNAIFLGRAMLSGTGITSDPAFFGVTVDRQHLDFDGNSQGGIMGLMLTAVSPDIERAVLGVPGMNYSLLLPRSVDFDDYEAVMKPAYPNDLDRMLIVAMLQMLWDRGEGAGYVQHVTSDPYPATPAKTVLLHVALGDHQVSQLSALIAARALGAAYVAPFAAPGRLLSDLVTFGLEPVATFPATGSAIVLWDSGSAEIPLEAVAPRVGRDPHEDPRADPDARAQKAAFLFEDQLIDVCNAGACTADQAG